MNMEPGTMVFKRLVDGPPEEVFYAFSTAQGWRDWLCDSAHFKPRSSRSYQLGWEGGWHASGSILTIDKPTRVELTWQGKDEPAPSKVTIELRARGQGTEVEIRHIGLGEGERWDEVRQQIGKGWEAGLENLESVCSTGVDLRVARQPMLGIMLNDFNEQIAGEIGVPVTKGVRIAEPIAGMGAEKVGLRHDDVIVEMAGVAIQGFHDLGAALRGQKAGDVVSVSVYRGKERVTVDMELSGRPLADVPLDPAELAERVQELYGEINQELQAIFEGVTEEEAGHKPEPEEWSAKQTLAHLIDSERYNADWLTEVLIDGEREFAEDGENILERLDAMISVTPTVQELLDRFKATQQEVLYMLRHADRLKARKGVLWRAGQGWLQYPGTHERQHMEQVEAAIEAARSREGGPVADD